MKQLLYSLPLLACPIGMGLMMWFMMRGKKDSQPTANTSGSTTDAEIAALRAQLDQLGAEHRDSDTAAGRKPGAANIRPY